MILRLAALSLLCLPFLGVWLGTRRTTIPEYRRHHRVLPHDTVTGDDPFAILNDVLDQVGPPPGWTPPLADQVPAAVEHVSFPCSGCVGESSRLRRGPPSFSSCAAFAIGEGSVTASSMFTTR